MQKELCLYCAPAETFNQVKEKSHLLFASFHLITITGHPAHWEGEAQGRSHSLPGTLGCARRHRLFHYTWQLDELTSLWCISPAVCFSREGGTQIILNETNNISVAVSAIKQTVPQYAIGRLKTRCSLNSMEVVCFTCGKKNFVKVFLKKIKEEKEHCISWVKFLGDGSQHWPGKGTPQIRSWRHLTQYISWTSSDLGMAFYFEATGNEGSMDD